MPRWIRIVRITATPQAASEAAAGHRRQVEGWRRDGRLHSAGAFRDGDGFVEVFEAADLLEADAAARDSPLVCDGLAAWFVREWIEDD